MGEEVIYGLAGFVSKPWNGYAEGNCKGFVKGTVQSFTGIVVIPAVGSLRGVESIS
jgi:hypothetical protein